MSRFQIPLAVQADKPPLLGKRKCDAKQPPLKKKPKLVQTMLKPASVQQVSKPRAGTVLRARYYIPKTSLLPEECEKLETDLLITSQDEDKKTVWQGHKFQAYTETEKGYFVPRFYGVNTFGPPARVVVSQGAEMTPDLKCNLVLQEQRRQIEAVDFVKKAFSMPHHWGGFLSLPCGYGKTDVATFVAIDVIRQLEGCPRRTLIIVPDSTLFDQWKKRIHLRIPGAKVGILRQNKMEIEGFDFVVAMVHSLAGRDDYPDLDTFGLMIIDEAHHMAAPMFSKALKKVPSKYILALSATPEMRSSQSEVRLLQWTMGPILFKPSRPPNENVLVKMMWYSQTPGRDVTTKQKKPLTHIMLQKMVDDPIRTQILLDVILDYYHQPGRNILVISKRLILLDNLYQGLLKHNVPDEDIGFIRGSVPEKERVHHKTRRLILAQEKLGKEGLDAPHLNTLIVAMPLSGVEQPIGRIQRGLEQAQETEEDVPFVPPHCVYLVDPYGLYAGLAWKNWHQFKSFGYTVQREDLQDYQYRHVGT
jgi:superfamily II DNA or RNA helicase